ncbi:MAG: M20/M25/M40 family metallo-hydrolase [Nitrospiraceae bacterium]|nr:M20/M25/M40 family metallo-hydrolase [Nitrospiraceae bacterium]
MDIAQKHAAQVEPPADRGARRRRADRRPAVEHGSVGPCRARRQVVRTRHDRHERFHCARSGACRGDLETAAEGPGASRVFLRRGNWTSRAPHMIAEIKGSEKPNEYVVLSAHFDSWSAASGATDNGTGTITMMEALRILKQVYPNPKRTIVVGHWNGEEQGLNGSRAFSEDHPEIVDSLQVLWNQDNGTGRIINMSSQGYVDLAGSLARWLALVPSEVSNFVDLEVPGNPGGGADSGAQ